MHSFSPTLAIAHSLFASDRRDAVLETRTRKKTKKQNDKKIRKKKEEKKKRKRNDLFGRDASLPALDTGLLLVTQVAYAQIGRGAYTVRATAYAHGHAFGARRIVGIHRVSTIARALIQTGALPVDARFLAEGFFGLWRPLHHASSRVGLDRKPMLAHASIRSRARTVEPAAVSAQRR